MDLASDMTSERAHLRVQRRLFEILEAPQAHDRLSRAINRLLVVLIVANIAAIILESVGTLSERYSLAFQFLEMSSLTIFIVEYLLRVWVCVRCKKFSHPLLGRAKYLCSPLALIDLVAILPSLLTGFTADFRFLRAIRVLRVLRIWKLTRYSKSLQIVRAVLIDTANQLTAVAAILFVIVIVSSGLMYVVEHPAQPEQFSSVLASIWWTLETLTMITYDDMAPITPFGKFLGVMIGLVGIGMFAMPAGILASAFIDQLKKRTRDEAQCCPKCGAPAESGR
jgi:voltage-gated potassium channel